MASQISINTGEAEAIYNKAMELKASIADQLAQLNTQIMDLPARGEWKGDAADKFMGIYSEMQSKITQDFPQLLEDLASNLNANLANLISADQAGA